MEQTDEMYIDGEHSGEHPMVQVIQHSPLPGRRWFAVGWVLFAVALILAILLIALPLSSYIGGQHRADQELDCRNRIGNALAAAQAQQISDLSDGLVIAFTNDDATEIQERLNHDGDRIDQLSDLKLDAVQICRDDPSYTPSPTVSPP